MQKKNGYRKKIHQWISRLSVKKKLVFYGYLTFSPVMFLICLVLFFHNYSEEVESRLANDISGVNSLAESVSLFQTDIKDISTYICINDEIHKLLVADETEELNSNAKLWLEKAPMQIVQDMISLNGDIKTVAIYPENGIRPYLRGMDASAYVSDMDKVHASTIYQETIASDNGMVWKKISKGPGEIYETNRTEKLVLCREIFDLTQKITLGYIVIGADQKRLEEMCRRITQGEDESVLILDRNGGELSRIGTLDEEVENYLKDDEFTKLSYKKRQTHFTCGAYEVICCQMSENASIVCKIVPSYQKQMKISNNVFMPLILLMGMLVGLCPLLFLISNIVTRPLHELSVAIREVSGGDFEQQVQVITEDEVGEVARCFNHMVEDIRTLIEENYVITLREKESELTALQAQINPHFLYNTLDSLYWQATEAGNDDLAENILALSQIFRLLLNRGKGDVTVGQEMELISRYLQIQKVRFEKRLDYKVEMEDSILDVMIPKLIIQPFVENAIVHGFENVSVPCSLSVTGKREDEYIRFEVSDTGIGMSREQIDAIWEADSDPYSKQRIGRYAIKNVRERLRLKYNEDFSLKIQSSVGQGTTVILRVPCREEKKHGN